MNGRRAAVLTLVFGLPALLFAQTSGAPPNNSVMQSAKSTLHLHANLIYVPVTVTDSDGTPVRNLRLQDFTLMEDGHPRAIRFFEQTASRPLSVVLAIDTSLSVRKDLPMEKQAAHNFVHKLLRGQTGLALTGFAGQVREYVPFTENAASIDRGLDRLRGDGPTALYAAIAQGAQMLQTQPGRRAIVVVSDGANSMPGPGYSQARMAAMRAEASVESVILTPISSNAGRNLGGEHALIQLSRDTGGQYFYVREPGDLQAALGLLAQSRHSEYLLGYYANPAQLNNAGRGGGERHIQVQLTHAASNAPVRLHFRSGYFLGPEQ